MERRRLDDDDDDGPATSVASQEQYGLSFCTSPASIAAAVGRRFRLLRLTLPLLLSSSRSIAGDGARSCLTSAKVAEEASSSGSGSGSLSSLATGGGVGGRRARFFVAFCFRRADADKLLSATGFLLCVRKVFVVSPLAFFLSNK